MKKASKQTSKQTIDMTTTANWSKAKEQVLSWIENEQHCVTAQRISQTLDLSRQQGSLLLNEILKEKSFQITTCQQTQEGNATGKLVS